MDPDESEPSDSPDDEVVEAESDDRAATLRRLAIQVDSQPSLLTAAQRLRRRLPGDERFGDPMSILRWRGRIVKRLGDGVMATFLAAPDALEAALEARAAVGEIDIDGYRPRLRAGVHWGSPRRLGGDYLGVDLNVAARVADAAKADQVFVSDVLLAQLAPGEAAELRTGRAKRLRADGAPRDLRVISISRVE